MDIQMEEYSTLVAESGRAFQLQAQPKRESSFPPGRGPTRTSGGTPGSAGSGTALAGLPVRVGVAFPGAENSGSASVGRAGLQ
jgi:hypothetical protein